MRCYSMIYNNAIVSRKKRVCHEGIHIVLVQTLMAIQLPDKEKPNTMQMYAAS